MSDKINGKPYVIDIMEEIAKRRKDLEKYITSPEYKKK